VGNGSVRVAVVPVAGYRLNFERSAQRVHSLANAKQTEIRRDATIRPLCSIKIEAEACIADLDIQVPIGVCHYHFCFIDFGMLRGVNQKLSDRLKQQDRLSFGNAHIAMLGSPYCHDQVMLAHIFFEPVQPSREPIFFQDGRIYSA
jgi:hypothetical protein